jgi:hypothetical protein
MQSGLSFSQCSNEGKNGEEKWENIFLTITCRKTGLLMIIADKKNSPVRVIHRASNNSQ